MRRKVIYVVSDIEKAIAFEWICQTINTARIELCFILLGKQETPLISFLKANHICFYAVPFSGKGDILPAWKKIYTILRKEKPDVVHTHLYYGNIIGLSAAWVLRISKRIYTRHHASIHHIYFPRAVMIDKLINALSTDIIVPSKSVERIVNIWEQVPASKLHLIAHGFDLDHFKTVDTNKVNVLRKNYNIPLQAYPVIGVISRYTEWKGVQYIIPAFKELLIQFPKAHFVLANAFGDYTEPIKNLLKTIPDDRYTEIRFENEIASLYKIFHVFIHAPVDEYCEAFGQTYIEALAAGIPSVFTLSGIACDFVVHEKNALVVNYRDTASIVKAVERILADSSLRENLIRQGSASAENFSLNSMMDKLEKLYLNER